MQNDSSPTGRSANRLAELVWHKRDLPRAVPELAFQAGYGRPAGLDTLPGLPAAAWSVDDDSVLRAWMHAAGERLDVELQAIAVTYGEMTQVLSHGAPALLRVASTEEPLFLALVRGGQRQVTLISPQGRRVRVAVAELRAWLVEPLESPWRPALQDLLTRAAIAPHQRETALNAMLAEQLKEEVLPGGWLLRLSPGAPWLRWLFSLRFPQQLGGLLALQALLQVLMLASWVAIGSAVFAGHLVWNQLVLWALLLLTMMPIQLGNAWIGSMLSLRLGAGFKERMLRGILQLHADSARAQGAGTVLGLAMEAEVLESLMVGGGLAALLALLELAVAGWVMSQGAGGWGHAASLLGWFMVLGGVGWSAYRRTAEWITAHRVLTQDLVERMVGHRTRLAQEHPQRWHEEEDIFVSLYLKVSQSQDRQKNIFRLLAGPGWLVVGVAGMAPALLYAGADLKIELAMGLGGVLLAAQAFEHLLAGWHGLIQAMIAAHQVQPILQAARQSAAENSGLFAQVSQANRDTQPLLALDHIQFCYPGNGRNILTNVSLAIRPGDRLLLEGPSGGGKSTLATVLAGLNTPDNGVIRLWGMVPSQLSTATWRRHVAIAPQFHENHIFTGTLAFNLLMGKRWPPQAQDLHEAQTLCLELGLGELLRHMPAGLQQMVGEGGWQLSHGERSRVFIARALLQQPDLLILDESFAALDPENLRRASQCVLTRAPAVLLIAHPGGLTQELP